MEPRRSISNSNVKRFCGDNTAGEALWEHSSMLYIKILLFKLKNLLSLLDESVFVKLLVLLDYLKSYMAVPKKRQSRQKKNSRRATWIRKANKQATRAFSLANSVLKGKSTVYLCF